MSELYEKSLRKLELDQVLALLAECAGSEGGKEACLKVTPSSDLEEVELMLQQTTAASDLCTRKGNPVFGDVSDVSAALERADRGGTLQPKELLRIAGVLRCARNIKGYVSEDDQETVLDVLFNALTPNKYLEDKIFGAILSEEEIADNASPALSDIRRHMRIQSGKIRDSLQKVISSPSYSKFLREPIITIRQGRYVVPVKSECKNDVPGLVHDVSATGSTYFVEPMSAVSANNALRELELKEKKEIERILAELSSDAAAHGEDINLDYQMLVRLDVIFAKAKLAYRMRAWAPIMNDQGKIELRNARHPLIDPKKVVPISVRLGSDFDTMIITGPNTGGKTVTLKTVGLLTLMAECGLHIPAGDGSCLSTFDAILADIGDEQSIAQSLSTFSSHMRTIVDVVEQCDDRTLVLFDELGAGTDPAEGAALAMAIIEFCRKMNSRVVATTHYAELKLYAMRTKGVINASCEFDVETLQPTYKLLIGIPGKSNAFAISRKLGLSEDILKEAGDLVGKSDKDFEDVLSQLEQQRQQMEAARMEAERLRQETAKIKQQSEEYNEQLRKEKEKAMEAARKEARSIIEEARSAANIASEELKALRKQLQDSADTTGINQRQAELRRTLNEAEEKLRTKQPEKNRTAPSRGILVGDTVELLKLGTKASVIAINKDGTYQLQAGILKLNAKADEIYLLENENPYKVKGGHPAHSGREMKMQAMSPEVDLRGMDSVEAVCVLERYLDEAMRANLPSVRIIHGKGTGALRAAVQQSLKKNKFVKSFRLGQYGEGEDGVTIAEFR
ncbi:MAG: endonuclease MutS2 [Candidatus Faecousia sp.]|nr:endonuclease MutS2 [Clostridiales bacterium]MDY6180644.1 endonuclease MutS2 [Candidatus Faecousia sp.]